MGITTETVRFFPQPGKQSEFLACPADYAFYGGSAGSGKSHGILLDGARWCKLPEFNGAIFRRVAADLKKPGSIWFESKKMYPLIGGRANNQDLSYHFGQHNIIKFSGLQHEDDVYGYQGAQLDWAAFDELTQFLRFQFFYITSRLRSSGGYVRPYARGATNPGPGWVLDMIEWWIDEAGYPIEERGGVVRWFLHIDDFLHWFDTREKAMEFVLDHKLDAAIKPLSFTFIPAKIFDNPALLEKDPEYLSKLHGLPSVEQERLLKGNWRIVPSGKLFRAEDFQLFYIEPATFSVKAVFVDTAQEIKTANDYTNIDLWGKFENKIYKLKQVRGKFDAQTQVDMLLALLVAERPRYCFIEAKANGSALIQNIRKKLKEVGLACTVVPIQRMKDKYTRGSDAQRYIKEGYVFINPRADYYIDFMPEILSFAPENKNKSSIHDDQVDTMMDAIEHLLTNPVCSDSLKPKVTVRQQQNVRSKFTPSSYQ